MQNKADKRDSLPFIVVALVAIGGLAACLGISWRVTDAQMQSRLLATVIVVGAVAIVAAILWSQDVARMDQRQGEIHRLSTEVAEVTDLVRELVIELRRVPISVGHGATPAGLVQDVEELKDQVAELHKLAANEAVIYLKGYMTGCADTENPPPA